MNKYYVYSIKIYRGAYYRLVNILRLMSAKIFHNGLTINGMLSLEKGVRFVTSKGGKINLSGPIWLHQLSTLQADGGRITIGENTSIGPFTIIGAIAEVTIGKNCMIAECVSIRDHDHCYTDPSVPMRVQGWTTRAVNIGDNVWLGGGVIVCPGVTIGHDSVVGAGSVVTRDIEPFALAVGNPAKVIRTLS